MTKVKGGKSFVSDPSIPGGIKEIVCREHKERKAPIGWGGGGDTTPSHLRPGYWNVAPPLSKEREEKKERSPSGVKKRE